MATPFTAIPLFTTPIPAFDLVDTLNGIINQINGNGSVLTNPEVFGSVLPWAASHFYGLPPGATPGTLLLTASTIYAYPVYIPGNAPIKTISIDSTTGQTGGAVHAGLYTDLNGAPNALVTGSDSGALAATGTAVATATFTTALNLTPGWYWLAMTGTASSTMPTVAAIAASYTSDLNALQGNATSLVDFFATSAQEALGVTATFTYGALPVTFPTTGYAQNVALAIPLVALGT